MNSVLLDNVTHRDLRVITTRGADWGDDVMSTPVFVSEFRSVQAHYPIVFHKATPDTAPQPVALLGLRNGENLFLDARGWDAHYVPLALERGPFMIGRAGEDLLVNIDLDSPRIGRGEGAPVFLPHGGSTEYLDRINSVLLAIHEGVQALPAFVDALLHFELLESFVLDIAAADGSQNRLAGFYTLAEERLAVLSANALGQLHERGYLAAIYMVMASTSHLRDLIERHNRRLTRNA
ncbi:MAG: SapC family protein [Betaproteobacteria bacterium]